MKKLILMTLVMGLGLGAQDAMAQGNSGKNKNKGGSKKVQIQPVPSAPSKGKPAKGPVSIQPVPSYSSNCPPGLAKKSPACIPPGQAKARYRVGDRYEDGYSWITNPGRYGLKGGSYIRAGDYVYQVDRDTQKVLNLIGAVADILN